MICTLTETTGTDALRIHGGKTLLQASLYINWTVFSAIIIHHHLMPVLINTSLDANFLSHHGWNGGLRTGRRFVIMGLFLKN